MNFGDMVREIAELLLCDRCLTLYLSDPYGEGGTIIADFCERCREKMGEDVSRLMAERFPLLDDSEEEGGDGN